MKPQAQVLALVSHSRAQRRKREPSPRPLDDGPIAAKTPERLRSGQIAWDGKIGTWPEQGIHELRRTAVDAIRVIRKGGDIHGPAVGEQGPTPRRCYDLLLAELAKRGRSAATLPAHDFAKPRWPIADDQCRCL